MQDLESSNNILGQQVEDQKLQRDREAYLDSFAANSHRAGAAVGAVSGFIGGAVGCSITASVVALPLIGLPVGVAAGVAVQNLTKDFFRQELQNELEKYEKEYFVNNQKGTKREAFEYAKGRIKKQKGWLILASSDDGDNVVHLRC